MNASSNPRQQRTRCLFCFKICSEVNTLWKDEIPGAVHCSALKHQLQNLFVLRYILNIDPGWCEDLLRSKTEAEEEFKIIFADIEKNPEIPHDNGSLEFWFKLCRKCTAKVEDVWRLHQELLGIQSRINLIKDEMKEIMKEGIRKNVRRNNGDVAERIREKVFPDLEPGSDPFGNYDGFQFDADDDDPPFTPSQVEVKVKLEETDVNIQSLEFKPRRGRPPKSKTKRKASSLISKRYIRRKRSLKVEPIEEMTKYKWWTCPQCTIKYKGDCQDKIKVHRERHQKSDEAGGSEFDCPLCTYPAQDRVQLETHHQRRHTDYNKPKERVVRRKCPKEGCRFKTRVQKVMLRHTMENHPELNLTKEDLWKKEKGNFLCSQCTRVFSNGSSLTIHLRAAHPELIGAEQEELQCDQCDLKFTTKPYLNAHITNVHKRDEFRFICDDCGQGFPFLAHLNRHKVTHYNKTKREHVCHICGVDYAHQRILVKHLKQFHGDAGPGASDQSEIFKCRYCPLETPFRAALKKHVESHKEELGFKCDQCSKSYTNAQGLRRHLRINHSSTEVACPYCNKKYVSMEYMKSHLKHFCKLKELKEQQQQQKQCKE